MTQFRDGFMMKSPLTKHGEKLRQEAKKLSGNVEQGDYDYENPKVTEKLEAAKKADKSHESDSAAKMSPFQGYVDGEERVSHYQPTADLYKDMIDTITSSVDKIAGAEGGKEKDSFKKAGKRVDKIADKGVDYEFGETLNDGIYAVGNKSKKENAFQKYLKP